MNISVIGCGRWGAFIAWYLDSIHHNVTVFGPEEAPEIHNFINTRTNGTITFDERVKPTTENLSKPDDTLWTSLTEHAEYVKAVVNRIEATGAKCYFGFGSVNACALTDEAKTEAQQKAFAELLKNAFDIEILGKPGNHVFDWKYMLPDGGSDFHLNDYGRPINTYRFYVEICEKLGVTPKGMKDLGTSFSGCVFE